MRIATLSLGQGEEMIILQKWSQNLGINTCGLSLKEVTKMLDNSAKFFKEKEYEKFIENGKFIAPISSIMLFCNVWKRLQEIDKRILFPMQIVWVNGAPGSGKGTNTRNVMRALNISTRPIVVSDLLNTDKFKEKIDRGELVDDEEVVFIIFKRIMEENGSIIVDGFPRTSVQADCIRLLRKQCDAHMIFVVLLIDERTSIQRQLARGKEAMEHNTKAIEDKSERVEVRKTDKDPELARLRYSEFYEKTHPALRSFRKIMDYYEIDAKGSFDEVRDRIVAAFQKK